MGRAQASCTEASGKMIEANARANAASHGQNTSSAQVHAAARRMILLSEKTRQCCRTSRTPGIKSTWLYGAALGAIMTVVVRTSARVPAKLAESAEVRRFRQQTITTINNAPQAATLPHRGVSRVSSADWAPSL